MSADQTPLAQRFASRQATTIDYEGAPCHSVVRFDIDPTAELTVTFVELSDVRPQALALAVGDGSLEVGDLSAPEIVLWSDTSPDTVQIEVNAPETTQLQVWNLWWADNMEHAWLGWAGIRHAPQPTETTGRRVERLECNDGYAPVDFTDLVVDLAIDTDR